MKHTLKLVLASLAMVCSSMASAAMYQVDIDTRTLEGQDGFIAFGLNGLSDSPLMSALISQYQGGNLGAIVAEGTFNVTGGLSSVLRMENLLPTQLTQGIAFGKKLQFNVEFEENNALLGSGTSFAFSLLDTSFNYLLSTDVSGVAVLAEFTPGSAMAFNSFSRADGKAVGTITPVPEPETYALIGLGLFSLAMQRRRSAHIKAV